jgi:cyclopropane-fatty-acyl-phospholipid synthase
MNELTINEHKASQKNNMSVTDRLARKTILAMLNKIHIGHLIIEENDNVMHFGQSLEQTDLIATIRVHHSLVYRDVFVNATVGSGEAYMQGAWSSPDLVKVIRLMVNNLTMLNSMDNKTAWYKKISGQLFRWVTANSLQGSRKNISAHYDLGNDFFQLFLDDTMMYSAAVFPEKDTPLYDASVNKLEQICQKLELTATDHVIEIGTGWGGFALYAAQHYGCRVTTTTISKEQYTKACSRVEAAGLQDKVTVLQQDYRNLEGQFDKLVSIEMIEAVGHEFYASYFKTCNALLKPDGRMLIQAITIPDQRYQQARKRIDFIKRYVFPGGCLPSNAVFTDNLAKHTDMQLIGFEDITDHYARTLACWRERFWNNIANVRQQGFDDVFIRMWDFYLAYCEGGFRERVISTTHFVCAKPSYRFQ